MSVILVTPWIVACQALSMGISQARIQNWVVISFLRGSSWSRDWTLISCLAGRFFTTEPPEKFSQKNYFSHKFENTVACSVVIVIRSTDSFSVIIESDIEYEIMLYNYIKFQKKCLENSPFKVLRSDNSFNYSIALNLRDFSERAL